MPKLEVYDAAADVPEALRPYYVEEDGRWYPDGEPLRERGHKAIEVERRQRAIASQRAEELARLMKEREAEVAELKAAGEPGEAARQKKNYDERIKAIEAQLAAEAAQRQAAEQKLAETRITDTLRTAALDVGVSKEAVEDLVALPRFRQPWKLDHNGEPAPYDGEVVRADHEGRPITAKAYTTEWVNSHKHWLPPSAGSGAQGGGVGRSGNGMVTVTRQQMKDAAFYRETMKKVDGDLDRIQIVESST